MDRQVEAVVSVWLMRKARPDYATEDFSRDFGLTGFGDDFQKIGGSDDFRSMPLADAFEPMSFSADWAPAALEQAAAMGLTECCRVILVGDMVHEPAGAASLPDDPVFLGSFRLRWSGLPDCCPVREFGETGRTTIPQTALGGGLRPPEEGPGTSAGLRPPPSCPPPRTSRHGCP